ncbi:TIGR04100 family radical SAM protein [Butyricicoccus sp.]|uniref:TIGR04100 family radical SAM protein n=1 Tax=Butyricicoccus sp. TaxID=2049021 RepID=UPI003D7E69C9
MKKEMTIVYDVHDGLYINLTNRCPCACTFCLRQTMDTVGKSGGLWLEHEPSIEEVKQAIDGVDLHRYTEVVFCGFGEPTERLDTLLEAAAYIKQVCPDKKIRINTNGLGDLVNGEPIAPKLRGLIDVVSVSLNTPNAQEYLKLTRSKFGEQSFDAMLAFAKSAGEQGIEVVMTTVDTTISHEEEKQCQAICDRIGARYRIRPWED